MPRQNHSRASRERWSERAAKPRSAKRVTLESPFAGLPTGTVLFIGTPELIRRYIESIPRGEVRTLERLRRDIARTNRCQAMCPVSTAIFLRLIAEVAWDELLAGHSASQITPFWRVIAPGTPIARRLRASTAWLREQRERDARGRHA